MLHLRVYQDFSRASTSLLAVSTGPITATLLTGHSKHPALRIPLGTFQLSSDLALSFPYPADDTLPAAWEVERYKKMPEITWTFKEKEKDVKTPVAVLGLLFVLAPWVVILGVVSQSLLCVATILFSTCVLISIRFVSSRQVISSPVSPPPHSTSSPSSCAFSPSSPS